MRAFLRAVCCCVILSSAFCQLDAFNAEGASFLETVAVTAPGAGILSGSSGPAPSLYTVVAVASRFDDSHNGQHSKHGGAKAHHAGDGGVGVGSGRSSSSGSSAGGQGRPDGTAGSRHGRSGGSKAERQEAPQPAVLRPTGNPAADAPLASATPLFGSPAAGTVIPGRYVVFFQSNISSTKVGLNRLHKHVKQRLLKDSSLSGAHSGLRVAGLQSDFAFRVTASLGDDSSSSSSSGGGGGGGRDAVAATPLPHTGLGVASAPSPTNCSSSSSSADASLMRPRGAVLEAPGDLDADLFVAAVQSATEVKAVYPDRVVSITQGHQPQQQQQQCAPSRALAGYTTPAPGLRWRGCKAADTAIYWFGERCGANLSKARWLGIYALNTTTSQLVPGCLRYRKQQQQQQQQQRNGTSSAETEAVWNRSYMGGCGVAPTAAPGLPTAVCSDAVSSTAGVCIPPGKLFSLRLSLSNSVTCSSTASSDVTYVGKRCGPGLGFVQWTGITVNHPSSSSQVGWQAPNWQQQQQWVVSTQQWQQPQQQQQQQQQWPQPGGMWNPSQQQQQQQPQPPQPQPFPPQGGWQQQQQLQMPQVPAYIQGSVGQQQQQQPFMGWQQQEQPPMQQPQQMPMQQPIATGMWWQQQQQVQQGMWQQPQQRSMQQPDGWQMGQMTGWQQQQQQPGGQFAPAGPSAMMSSFEAQTQKKRSPRHHQVQQQQQQQEVPGWQLPQQQQQQVPGWQLPQQQQQQQVPGWQLPQHQQQQQVPGWQLPQHQQQGRHLLASAAAGAQAACTFKASPSDLKFNADWIGSCGVSPLNIPLPTAVCTSEQLESGADSSSQASGDPDFPPKPGQAGKAPPAGPTRPSAPPADQHFEGWGSTPNPQQQQQPSSLPPAQPPLAALLPPAGLPAAGGAPLPPSAQPPLPPPPSPAPTGPGVPTMPMAEKEFLPTGVQLVEGGYGGRVADLSAAPVQGVVVAVVDTGVDKNHPDLNVVGGMNMVADEPHLSFSDDSHGHGTHVAGTIGAKNQGKGIVGVAPGVGIYGIRVLRADGNGAFSDLVRTYDHLLKEGRRLGIRVVNLSLSGSGTAEDVECQYISQLIAQGMTVVTAAGNSGISLRQEVPAACPGTLVVTAISDNDGSVGAADKPPSWSNYLPLPDTDNIAARMLAAPGDQITSTYPMDRGGFNGYARMSGTSMACPHVSGIVALCYASGVCASNSTTEYPAVISTSVEYVEGTASYRYTHDPLTSPLADKYYGYLAWARKWWAA